VVQLVNRIASVLLSFSFLCHAETRVQTDFIRAKIRLHGKTLETRVQNRHQELLAWNSLTAGGMSGSGSQSEAADELQPQWWRKDARKSLTADTMAERRARTATADALRKSMESALAAKVRSAGEVRPVPVRGSGHRKLQVLRLWCS